MINDTRRILLVAAALLFVGGTASVACNSHPVDYRKAGGAVEHLEQVSGGGGSKVDILWVIDNSLSMCQEQEALRQNFNEFITTLDKTPINFNVAVTTTHFASKSVFETIARPGRLQSTPHPPVGFQDACRFNKDDNGNIKNYKPVRQQIKAAVQCTKNPDQFQKLLNWTDKELKCALVDKVEKSGAKDPHTACEDVGKMDSFSPQHLFPCGDKFGKACNKRSQFEQVYRNIPNVLRAKNYRKADGSLRVGKLRKDFACMSYVGTRGDSFEQGLNAAAMAVSPHMTGGPANDPFKDEKVSKYIAKNPKKTDKGEPIIRTKTTIKDGSKQPNHGFLRADAKTALLFITDENDCSHVSNKIQELSAGQNGNKCGELNCYFPTAEGDSSDTLLKTQKIFDAFIENLAQSKRLEDGLKEGDLIIGSIHGDVRSFSSLISQQIPKKCSSKTQTKLRKKLRVCATSRGAAKSGGRYADFMSMAGSAGQTVVPENPVNGFMCKGDLSKPLKTIARKLQGELQGCLKNRVLPCNPKAKSPNCPKFEYGEGGGNICPQWGKTTGKKNGYCASALRLRLSPTSGSIEELKPNDKSNFRNRFCIKESIGEPAPNACIVKRNLYRWKTCEGDDSSVALEWNTSKISDPGRAFGAFKVQARYTEELGGGSGGGSGGGPDAGN